jgi:segregation and condensation protein B
VSYDRAERVLALQAVIFAAESPCEEERLALVLEVPLEDIEELVEELSAAMGDSALQIVRLAGGYQMATRPRYAGYVQRLREPEPERLSAQALETLAIVAYLQPITRPEIDEIRGVNSTGSVNGLLEKGLIEICGRKDAPGRPFLLSTTAHFLSAFGLSSLEELPELSPTEGDFREQLRELVASGEIEPEGLEAGVETEGEAEGDAAAEDEPAAAEAEQQAAEPDGSAREEQDVPMDAAGEGGMG